MSVNHHTLLELIRVGMEADRYTHAQATAAVTDLLAGGEPRQIGERYARIYPTDGSGVAYLHEGRAMALHLLLIAVTEMPLEERRALLDALRATPLDEM